MEKAQNTGGRHVRDALDEKRALVYAQIGKEQQEKLLENTAERNGLSENDDLKVFLRENYKDKQSREYLVDGAVLTCTNCTRTNVSIMIDGKTYDYCAPKSEDELKQPIDNSKIYGRLTVTENADACVSGQVYATVADSQKQKNIPYFGNCLRPPANEAERAKFREFHNDAGLEKRKEGSCKYLMKLNRVWENYEIGEKFLTFGDDMRGEVPGITMTSMLFCRHGGFIYPVSSGQISNTDDDFFDIFGNLDDYMKAQIIDFAVTAASAYYRAKVEEMLEHGKVEARAFIPQKVPNDVIFFAMEMLSINYPIFKKTREENAAHNLAVLNDSGNNNSNSSNNNNNSNSNSDDELCKSNEYIEDQRRWEEVKYGNGSTMDSNGCGVIATYNALWALGENVSKQTMVDLISRYEQSGAVLYGQFGTSPYQIEQYFKEKGYDVISTRSREEGLINDIGDNSDTVIATVYNNRNDIMGQLHTVCITKDENGKYSIHNMDIYDSTNKVYIAKDNNGAGYDTLQDAINDVSDGASASISVIGISNPVNVKGKGETDGAKSKKHSSDMHVGDMP